jgi:hypothetical protein
MTVTSEALVRIKRGCQVSGVTLSDVFSEYDRQRSGVISLTQVQRAFSNYGIRLKNQEYRDIAIEFKSGDGISIPAFVAAVNDCDARRQFNVHPEVTAELQAIAHELGMHHQTVRDCTKAPRGVVSSQDFIRAVSPVAAAETVANAFADKETGEISIAEVDHALKIAALEPRPQTAVAKPPQVIAAIEHVVRRAVEICGAFRGARQTSEREAFNATFCDAPVDFFRGADASSGHSSCRRFLRYKRACGL